MNNRFIQKAQMNAVYQALAERFPDAAPRLCVGGFDGEWIEVGHSDPPEGFEQDASDVGRLALWPSPAVIHPNEISILEIAADPALSPLALIVTICGQSLPVDVDVSTGSAELELTSVLAGRIEIRHDTLPARAFVEVVDA